MSKTTKNILRAKMLRMREDVGPDKISELNRGLCKNLSFIWNEGGALGSSSSKPLWAAYKSFRWEADPQDALSDASPFLRWAFPRVVADTVSMEFYEPPSHDALWLKNQWGIWEPDPRSSRKISLNECVGILVPGVAFDRHGHRLGYGKGFYDRALSEFKGLKVGVALSSQILDEALPSDPTDVPMDFIVTEIEILRTKTDHQTKGA